MHNLIKSQIRNLNNLNFHYILIILIKFPFKCSDCSSSFIIKMRRLEKKLFLLRITSETVNHLVKAEKKDNEKQNWSKVKMNLLCTKEIYDSKNRLNSFDVPKKYGMQINITARTWNKAPVCARHSMYMKCVEHLVMGYTGVI